jgi:hypothetical protein
MLPTTVTLPTIHFTNSFVRLCCLAVDRLNRTFSSKDFSVFDTSFATSELTLSFVGGYYKAKAVPIHLDGIIQARFMISSGWIS